MRPETVTPAQERLVDELLQWDQPRPAADFDVAARLRSQIEDGVADVAVPPGETLFLSKSRLEALVCEGRFLGQQDEPFSWPLPALQGKLAHRCLELDWRAKRSIAVEALVDQAVSEATADAAVRERFDELTEIERAELWSNVEQMVYAFRDSWPVIPSEASPRLEQGVAALFAGKRVKVSGVPDLVLGRHRDDRARVMIVDFKTGSWRHEAQELAELRLYGLLLTLRHGVPPFRWAVYYVQDGGSTVEDATPELLDTAARRIVDGAHKAAKLLYRRPAESELNLVPGGYCRFCPRRQTCPVAAVDD